MVESLIANEKIHYIPPHHGKVFLDKMWEIGKAIKESRYIEITYEKIKKHQTVTRKVQPQAIMFSEFYFYLAAYIDNIDKEKEFAVPNDIYPTIYRIDRITEIRVLDEHFKIPYRDRFEEGEYRKRIQFMYGGRLQKTVFWYKGNSVEAVLDRIPTAKVLQEEDGKYLISAETFGDGIYMWIRSQGEQIEIVNKETNKK
jgi:predicted DNA-binding transcriptional regulator YafY